MIRGVLGSRASIGGPLGSGRGGAAAAAWYLAGGVSAANCVAAYRPIGAASLAASYVNLANPGTYNAAPGIAPTWAATTGWTFNGSDQYLSTGIVPTLHDWSMMARFSDSTVGSHLAGVNLGTNRRWILTPYNIGLYTDIYFGGLLRVSNGGRSSGVIGNAGSTGYYNGASIGAIPTGTAGALANIYIGASYNGTNAASFWPGKIQALAIYNTTLTAPQVAAISSAMSAL